MYLTQISAQIILLVLFEGATPAVVTRYMYSLFILYVPQYTLFFLMFLFSYISRLQVCFENNCAASTQKFNFQDTECLEDHLTELPSQWLAIYREELLLFEYSLSLLLPHNAFGFLFLFFS